MGPAQSQGMEKQVLDGRSYKEFASTFNVPPQSSHWVYRYSHLLHYFLYLVFMFEMCHSVEKRNELKMVTMDPL